ncbi:hypothetical protein N8I74_13460 [Chitiniphilus purpureus]|uniref:Tetratricopeptide repeat protein n=1 Tax=Chitiniphilus purpureus TaxID=2981137 RepID=A0ABY6DIZ8_9NEIS|nr:hypothetical protein [Chitiniphilus sp. CD1]UXY14319.1 hypothetical protein N8I74_13460 [Chitiniphilus sp. CD1]
MRALVSSLLLAMLLGCGASGPKAEKPARVRLAEAAMQAGNRAYAAERYQDAAASWQSAFDAYRSIDDWRGQGEARLGLAQAFARQQQRAAARNVLLDMPGQGLFAQAQRVRAAYQLALLAIADDAQEAAGRLAQARALCTAPCVIAVQLDNLAARLALPTDPGAAERLAQAVLAQGEDVPAVERAAALRLIAQARLQRGEPAAARAPLEAAIALDRVLAEPGFLADDLRLLVQVAQALNDGALLHEATTRLAGVCAGQRIPECTVP